LNIEQSDETGKEKEENLQKRNRFIIFQHLIEDAKKSINTSQIVSKLVKYFANFPPIISKRNLNQIIQYDKISVFVLDKKMKIVQNFDVQTDCHCKFHKVRCLKNWIDAIYDLRGVTEPAFNTIEKANSGFRSYFFTIKE